jgi:hypothetical protein
MADKQTLSGSMNYTAVRRAVCAARFHAFDGLLYHFIPLRFVLRIESVETFVDQLMLFVRVETHEILLQEFSDTMPTRHIFLWRRLKSEIERC